tara:strand:+ start:786 stop:1115 length:330 start_codon:yes stop_codon:yes gene_type:complete
VAKKQGNKPEVVYEYIETLSQELYKRFGDNPTTKDVLGHLVERGMVEKKRLRNYMMIADFDKNLKHNDGNRTVTFIDLSIKYDVSVSQAQNIVYRDRIKSKMSSNISVA